MMTQAIDATLFASTHPDIARRTNLPSVFYSLAMMAAGVVLFITLFELHDSSATLSMASMVIATALVVYAVYRLFWRSKEMVYLPTGSVTRERSLFFDLKHLDTLTDMIDHDAWSADTALPSDAGGNVRLDVLMSKDGKFAAVQLFRFVPYSYTPVTSVHYYIGSEASPVSAFLLRCKCA